MPFEIVRNDIVHMRTDAIVNAANSSLAPGGGVCGAIFAAAGYEEMSKACRAIGHCAVGGAVLTKGFALSAKYVIHAVGPIWQGGGQGEAEALRSCYMRALELAEKKRCRSVAFPLISAGIYGYPAVDALKTAVRAIGDFLLESEMQVYLVIYDRKAVALSGKLFARIQSFVDDNYVDMHASERRRGTESILWAEQLREQGDAVAKDGPAFEACFESAEMTVSAPGEPACSDAEAGLEAEDSGETDPTPASAFAEISSIPPPGAAAHSSVAASVNGMREPEIRPMQTLRKASSASKMRRPARSLEEMLGNLGESFSGRLLRLIDERGLTDVEVYKRANIDRKLFSKIRKGNGYNPSKPTALALAVALQLDMDETRDLLARAGYALSRSSKFDVIIEYFILEGNYDIYEINEALFAFEQHLLGA